MTEFRRFLGNPAPMVAASLVVASGVGMANVFPDPAVDARRTGDLIGTSPLANLSRVQLDPNRWKATFNLGIGGGGSLSDTMLDVIADTTIEKAPAEASAEESAWMESHSFGGGYAVMPSWSAPSAAQPTTTDLPEDTGSGSGSYAVAQSGFSSGGAYGGGYYGGGVGGGGFGGGYPTELNATPVGRAKDTTLPGSGRVQPFRTPTLPGFDEPYIFGPGSGFQLTPVPEPASIVTNALVLIGVGAGAWWHRRRRKA